MTPDTPTATHRAGFVSILGKPNAGKSTLLNAFLGQKLSIVTPKAQTTRHRIFGIADHLDYQIVFSDTPGILTPGYALQKSMMDFVKSSLDDADAIIFLVDPYDIPEADFPLLSEIAQSKVPILGVVNKTDVAPIEKQIMAAQWLQQTLNPQLVFNVSASHLKGTADLLQTLVQLMPVQPPYYDKGDLSDRTERFFTTEIIREKIFLQYQKEIPYCCEVGINSFQEKKDMHVISAEIYVERDSQKPILIGKKGEAILKLGIAAREALEIFFEKKVYLDLHVRVSKDWRKNKQSLKRFGYEL